MTARRRDPAHLTSRPLLVLPPHPAPSHPPQVDLEALAEVGPRGVAASCVGVLLGAAPLAFVVARFGLRLPPRASLAVAASLSPSSTGAALACLKRHR